MTYKMKKADFQPGRSYSRADWDEVSDSPEATAEQLAEAEPFVKVFPELAEKMRRARPAENSDQGVGDAATR